MQNAEDRGFAMFSGSLKGLENVLFGEIFLHPRISLRGGRRGDFDRLGGGILALLVPFLIAEFLIDRCTADENASAEHRGHGKEAHASHRECPLQMGEWNQSLELRKA